MLGKLSPYWATFQLSKHTYLGDGRDGLAVKSLIPSISHGVSQSSIVPFPGDQTPSSVLGRHQGHTWCRDINAGKTLIHIIK